MTYTLRASQDLSENQIFDILCQMVTRLPDLVISTAYARGTRGVRVGAFGAVTPVQVPAARRHSPLVVKMNQTRSQYKDFIREAQLLHSLNHTHIVSCPGMAWIPRWERVLILMPRLEVTLLDCMRHQQLPWSTGYRVCRQTGDALVYLHGQNIIHRDLTTSNIMLSCAPAGKAVIVDFGRAMNEGARNPNTQRIPGHSSHTMFGALVNLRLQSGDLRLAPEMFFGRHVAATGDIYGWGLLLLQALRGDPFWISWTNVPSCQFGLDCRPGQPHLSHYMTELEHIRSCIDYVPTWSMSDTVVCQTEPAALLEVQRLARSCLDLDPQQRPQTMSAALAVLRCLEPRLGVDNDEGHGCT
ncbi:MAG: protein kinase [Kistimonas sp.]|nr:protein kinase [Kistimonas sp.]